MRARGFAIDFEQDKCQAFPNKEASCMLDDFMSVKLPLLSMLLVGHRETRGF